MYSNVLTFYSALYIGDRPHLVIPQNRKKAIEFKILLDMYRVEHIGVIFMLRVVADGEVCYEEWLEACAGVSRENKRVR